ncbi:hypothetical protein ACFQAT_16975 [Undibacterium arcticum]|uniref:Gel scht n=1 Tax=Undibacterium arcticum TaxID=1762892 RepID=A0ABV7F9J5_9BURK
MNKLITSALAAAALASLSSAYAAPAVGSDDSAAAQRIQVTGPSTYKLAPHEFDDFAYAYGLETGQTLKLRQQVNRYFTQLKGQPEVEIFGQSPGTFVSRAGTTLTFRDDGYTVVVTYADRLQTASTGTHLPSRFVASR